MDTPAPPGASQPDTRLSTIVIEDEVLRAGFTQIPNAVLRREDVTPGAKLTYMVLLSYAWQHDSAFPGHDRMARDMGVSRRSVVTYLQQLQELEFIRIERRGLGQTNIYYLTRHTQIPPDPRSANSAHQEVQKTTHQEVQDLRTKKTKSEENTDGNISNVRKVKPYRNRPEGAVPPQGGDLTSSTSRTEDPRQIPDQSSTEPQTPGGPNPTSSPASGSPRTGLSSVGEVLGRRSTETRATGNLARQGRSQKPYPEERERILAYIEDFGRELGDEAPLASSVTRAYNLWRHSGVPIEAFTVLMYEARSRTKEYSANVTKRKVPKDGDSSLWGPGKNRMAYFFGILENQLELVTSAGSPSEVLARQRQRLAPSSDVPPADGAESAAGSG